MKVFQKPTSVASSKKNEEGGRREEEGGIISEIPVRLKNICHILNEPLAKYILFFTRFVFFY